MSSTATGDVWKTQVRDFWEDRACGEVYAEGHSVRERLSAQAKTRYALEPYIFDLARFDEGRGRDVLEIGVGMGADHLEWARCGPRSLSGIDLTHRAAETTARRFTCEGFESRILVADGEQLPFSANAFDLVFSYGVLHHSPDTARAFAEVHRVLRPGGCARVMVYHSHSIVGYILWFRYALLAGRPWRSLREIYAAHLESPGTKAFSTAEVEAMTRVFASVRVWTQLSFGDLLHGAVGQRHRGRLLTFAKAIWPRWLIQRFGRRHGLLLFAELVK